MNEDLVNHLKDHLFHLVHWWNITQTRRETNREFINWEGDILIADIEELEKLIPEDRMQVLITHKTGEFVFPVVDCSATLSGRDYELQEPTLRRKPTVGERIKAENLKARGESFNLKKQRMTRKSTRTFGLFKETSFIVIILNPVFNFLCQEKSHFLSHCFFFFDVIKSTHTNLDVAQEKRIDDNWNVDENRNLSDSWRGFTRCTLLKETPPKGFLWSRERLTKIQTTSRPDHIWPDAWTRIGEAAQRREQQECATEKPKLEHARKLRGIGSFDPSDEEYNDIINAR